MSLRHTSPENLCTSLMVTCPVLFLKLMLMTGSRTLARQKGKVVSLSSDRSSKSLTMNLQWRNPQLVLRSECTVALAGDALLRWALLPWYPAAVVVSAMIKGICVQEALLCILVPIMTSITSGYS